jgi:hypothetical protein
VTPPGRRLGSCCARPARRARWWAGTHTGVARDVYPRFSVLPGVVSAALPNPSGEAATLRSGTRAATLVLSRQSTRAYRWLLRGRDPTRGSARPLRFARLQAGAIAFPRLTLPWPMDKPVGVRSGVLAG